MFKDYDGKKDPNPWLQTFNLTAHLFGWPADTRLNVAITKLSEAAQQWAQSRHFNNWDEFQAQLDRRFGESQETAIARLETCRQGNNEPPRAFADRFLHDAERAGRAEDAALVFTFMQRLQSDLKQEVLRKQPQTIDDAVEYANWWLSAQGGNEYPAANNNSNNYSNNNSGNGGGYSSFARPTYNTNNSGGGGTSRAPYNNRPNARNEPPARSYVNNYRPNNNPFRPLREMTNRARAPVAPAAKPASTPAVDDLVRGLANLQINNLQQQNEQKDKQLQDKDRTIRTLQYALEGRTQQINMCDEEQAEDVECNYGEHLLTTADGEFGEHMLAAESEFDEHLLAAADYDLIEQLLAEIMAKRAAEGDAISRQIPAKRTAINPASSPYVPSRPTYLQRPGHVPTNKPTAAGDRPPLPARMPRNRTPLAPMATAAVNGTSRPPQATTAGTSHAPLAPQAAAARNTAPRAAANTSAANLANEKAKKIVTDICRSIKMDGQVEDTLPLKAVLFIVAGKLAGIPKLIQLGEDMAVQADSLMKRMAQSFRLSEGAALFSMAALTRPPRAAHVAELLSRSQPAAARVTTRTTTPLRTVGCLNGYELGMVVDTGATTSAVGIDCLRRCDLTHKIRNKPTSYITADGTVAAGRGKAPNLVLGIGEFQTKINPTVTAAINYDVLIGVDVLKQGKAVIDFGTNTMRLQVDPENYVEVPISTDPGAEDTYYYSKENAPVSAPPAASSTTAREPAATLFMGAAEPANADGTVADSPTASSTVAAPACKSFAAATCGSSMQEQQQDTTGVCDEEDDTGCDSCLSESGTIGDDDDTYSLDSNMTFAPSSAMLAALSTWKRTHPSLNAPPPTLQHGSVTPLPSECADSPVEDAIRLVSTLPPTDKGTDDTDATSRDQINMLDRPPKRKSAAAAIKRLHKWTTMQRQTITEDSDVPSDLPCEICDSPYGWKNMLLCDVCQAGYHTYCVGLSSVPQGSWTCYYCLHPPPGPPTISNGSPDPPATDNGGAQAASDGQAACDQHAMFEDDTSEEAASEEAASEEDKAADDTTSEEDSASADGKDATTAGAILEVWDDAAMLQYLQTRQFDADLLPDTGAGKEMHRIEKRAAGYYWNADSYKLFKRPCEKHPQLREVPPPYERVGLIDQLHQETGHLGTTKLCSVLLARYYWRGVYEQVAARIRDCDDCTRHKTLFKLKPELQPIPPSKIWNRVHLDTMGPYPPSRHGNRFLCVGIDAMSKYVECWAVPTMNSDTMCRFFMQHICANHGLPSTVVTDNGKEFQHTFPELMEQLGIQHLHSGAYNPQANGQVEAAVKTILHGLQKAVGTNANAWDDKLPLVLLGQRSAVHSTTGYSPFYINTGRNPVLPAERRFNPAAAAAAGEANTPPPQAPSADLPPRDPRRRLVARRDPTAAGPSAAPPPPTPPAAQNAQDKGEEDSKDEVDRLLDPGTELLLQQRNAQRAADYEGVATNILRSQAKQRVDYAKRLHGPDPKEELPPGSLALMWMPPKNKLQKTSAVEGPYLVVEHTSGSQVVLEDAKGSRWAVAVSRLAPYRK
jgi:transposase InsO family protein